MVFDKIKGLSPAMQGKYWTEVIGQEDKNYAFSRHKVDAKLRGPPLGKGPRSASEPQLAHGRMQREAIPGYTGFVAGCSSENVHSSIHSEANSLAATAMSKRGSSDVASERTRLWKGDKILAGSIDKGSLSAAIGTDGKHGPPTKAASYYYNPRGHSCLRSGSAVPGYAAHIPGKYAGNVFGARVSQDNLAASGTRRREGAENRTNWMLAAEFDKRAKAHGAHEALGGTLRSIGFHESGRAQQQVRMPEAIRHPSHSAPSGWRLYEPYATHEKLRY